MEIEQSSVITYNKSKIEVKRLENQLNKLIECYQAEKLCDVTLVAGLNKRRIAAHRLILSTASPYFNAMFENDLREKNATEIVLEEIHGDELKMIIDYCYTGYIDINSENVYRILETASRMEFVEVEKKCSDFLDMETNVLNCLRTWTSVEPFLNLKQITEKAKQFAEANFLEIIDTHEFLLLDPDHLYTLLSSDNLDVWSEEEVFNALPKWVNYDKETTKGNVPRLLTAIRFTQLSSKFLYRDVKQFCAKYDCDADDLIKNVHFWKTFPEKQPISYAPRKSTTMKWLIALDKYRFDHTEGIKTEMYSPFTNTWRISKKITWVRDGSSHTIANGELYILGGRDRNNEFSKNSVQSYNFMTNEMKDVPAMNVDRLYSSAAALDGNIYVTLLNRVEGFDLKTGKWSDLEPMLVARYVHTLVALCGRLFVIGGLSDKNKRLESVECYDPFKDEWQMRAPMNHCRVNHSAAVHNNQIYVAGGLKNVNMEGTVECYDSFVDKWTIITHSGFPLYTSGLTISGEHFIVAGGANSDSADVYKVHVASFQKEQIASMRIKNKKRSFNLLEIPSYDANSLANKQLNLTE